MSEALLDRLFATMSTQVHSFALCQVQRGWRLAKQGFEDAHLVHFILVGEGEVIVSGQAPLAFRPYAMIIPPRGVPHTIGFAGADHTAVASDALATLDNGTVTLTAGDGSKDMLFACGVITASCGGEVNLFDRLQNALVEDLSSIPRLRHAFAFMIEEMSNEAPGTREVAGALMKQCLLLLVRAHLGRQGIASPIFEVLKDPQLSQAVVAVLESPGALHSVESLAKLCGMSRTVFAKRFAGAYGQGPIDFLQRVRFRLAAQLLTTTSLPVKIIALRVGYASRSYFTHAFKINFGIDPTAYRHEHMAEKKSRPTPPTK